MLKRGYSMLLALLLVTTSLLSAPAQPVSAAGGAQQIYFSCASGVQGISIADYVVIKGNNQYGQPATWQGQAYWANGGWSTFVFARNWWWTGKVRIGWWMPGPDGGIAQSMTFPLARKAMWSTWTVGPCGSRIWCCRTTKNMFSVIDTSSRQRHYS